ncbi:hypothetical protein C7212DRAFT_336439 [Tuber magnatum]|uniref:Uncharacterized protein n=1 Tax=Tuber magnatum TaxID=42249 RepID=A0A317SDB4_9PEZI|nr:hypothetical protein C7212DRAFT_336439 [Tuber magnatum]
MVVRGSTVPGAAACVSCTVQAQWFQHEWCTAQASDRHLILKSDPRLLSGMTLCTSTGTGTRTLLHYSTVDDRTATELTYGCKNLAS